MLFINSFTFYGKVFITKEETLLVTFLVKLSKVYNERLTYLLAPKLKPPVRPVVAGALDGVPKENDILFV